MCITNAVIVKVDMLCAFVCDGGSPVDSSLIIFIQSDDIKGINYAKILVRVFMCSSSMLEVSQEL